MYSIGISQLDDIDVYYFHKVWFCKKVEINLFYGIIITVMFTKWLQTIPRRRDYD